MPDEEKKKKKIDIDMFQFPKWAQKNIRKEDLDEISDIKRKLEEE